jgi:hypothetical protein
MKIYLRTKSSEENKLREKYRKRLKGRESYVITAN